MTRDDVIKRLKDDIKRYKKRLKYYSKQDELNPGVEFNFYSMKFAKEEILFHENLLSLVLRGKMKGERK